MTFCQCLEKVICLTVLAFHEDSISQSHSIDAYRLRAQRQPFTLKNNAGPAETPTAPPDISRAHDPLHLLFPLRKYKCASNLSLLASSLFCQYGP